MKAFNYQAVNQQGTKKSGIIEADSAKAVRQQLRERGLIPIDVHSIEKNVAPNRQKNKLKVRELSLMTRQLATLIAARLPIEQALQGVSEQSEKKQTKSILLAVRSNVLEGHSLANALKQFPNAFPPLYCATIEAGEQTGKLDIVLNRLADYTDQQHAMRLKVHHALIYPSVMTVISIGIITFLLTFVVPKIIGVFNSTGQSLPQLTQTLIHISDFIKQHGLLTFGLMIIALMAFKQAL
jgi:general secretion pathway protein F